MRRTMRTALLPPLAHRSDRMAVTMGSSQPCIDPSIEPTHGADPIAQRDSSGEKSMEQSSHTSIYHRHSLGLGV